MFRNYLKIARRNLLRNKLYSLINIFGLALGLACSLLVGLWVFDELTFDQYHRNTERIFRANLHLKWAENDLRLRNTPPPLGPALQRDYPEVSNVLRIRLDEETLFQAMNKSLYAPNVIYADSTLFSFFDYDFVEGDPQSALSTPNGLVLTEKLANDLFGSERTILGQTVLVKENMPFTVTAVIRNPPASHHLKFAAIIPFVNVVAMSGMDLNSWENFNSLTYLMLGDKGDGAKLESKMAAFYKKNIAQSIGDDGNADVTFDITFQPLAKIHLHSSHLTGEENGGSMGYVYVFSAIGLFILVIALFNYINLTTARSTGRAKEIGVRKAVGSQRIQLIGQFLAESLITTFIAMGVGLILLYALLPAFNSLADKSLSLNVEQAPTLAALAGLILLIGLIGGLYPALVLSRFKTTDVLKGGLSRTGGGIWLRQSLVVGQFVISIVMIVGTMLVYRQLQFMRHSDLGFNQEQVLVIPLKFPSAQLSANILKDKVLQSTVIKSATLTNGSIGKDLNNKMTYSFYANGTEQPVSTEYFSVDEDFRSVLQVGLVGGRDFIPDSPNDSAEAVMINESMLRRLGWKDRTDGLIEVNTKKVQIAGVIKDFHLRSLHQKIEPLVLRFAKSKGNKLLIRVAPQSIPAALTYAREQFENTNPGQPFDYTFLDQTFDQQYKADERQGELFLGCSGIAIFIACLGLFGLATFTAEQRTKEIGIRKVLGASVASIVALLSKDFLKPVLIAIVIASPIAWYAMNEWLADFAYKIDIGWWVFALAGVLAVGIALLTVGFQSVRAAMMNPVKSLRSE